MPELVNADSSDSDDDGDADDVAWIGGAVYDSDGEGAAGLQVC
jgi:hypothetical protein